MAAAAARRADPLLVRPLRAGRRLRRRADEDDRRPRRATSTSSTARRRSSRTRATPPGRSSSRRPTRTAAHKGMSAFIVPMDTPGVTIEKHLDKMGQRATDTSGVRASRTSSCPRRTGSARRATASRSRCRRSTSRARARRSAPSASPRRRTSTRVEYAKERVTVRRADRDAPGRQLPDRRHGDRDRGLAPAHLAGRVDARPAATAARRRSTRRSRSASPPTPR